MLQCISSSSKIQLSETLSIYVLFHVSHVVQKKKRVLPLKNVLWTTTICYRIMYDIVKKRENKDDKIIKTGFEFIILIGITSHHIISYDTHTYHIISYHTLVIIIIVKHLC